MNSNIKIAAFGLLATLMTIAVVSMVPSVDAKKTETCTVGNSDTLCNDTGVNRDSSPAARTTCTNPSGNSPGSCSGNVNEE